jgi:hypothetical protein
MVQASQVSGFLTLLTQSGGRGIKKQSELNALSERLNRMAPIEPGIAESGILLISQVFPAIELFRQRFCPKFIP